MKKFIPLVRKSLVLTPLVIILSVAMAQAGMTSSNSTATPTVWLDPPRIDGTGKVGQLFNVSVMVSTPPDIGISIWQAGISFDTTVLNCTDLGEGDYFAGMVVTGFVPGTIYNELGYVTFSGNSLDHIETGKVGTGTLMWFTFNVTAEGISDLHLEDTKLNEYIEGAPLPIPIPHKVIDVYTVIWEEVEHLVRIVHNVTAGDVLRAGLSNHAFDPMATELSFTVTGPPDRFGFCNVTIPKGLMDFTLNEWEVKVDGADPTYFPTPTENATHTFVHFEFTTTGDITPLQATIVPEFPSFIILPLFMITTLLAFIIYRRKHSMKH